VLKALAEFEAGLAEADAVFSFVNSLFSICLLTVLLVVGWLVWLLYKIGLFKLGTIELGLLVFKNTLLLLLKVVLKVLALLAAVFMSDESGTTSLVWSRMVLDFLIGADLGDESLGFTSMGSTRFSFVSLNVWGWWWWWWLWFELFETKEGGFSGVDPFELCECWFRFDEPVL
jgi:hypothetical protein